MLIELDSSQSAGTFSPILYYRERVDTGIVCTGRERYDKMIWMHLTKVPLWRDDIIEPWRPSATHGALLNISML